MSKEFINPNWHVLLIHYPLGLFVAGLVIELLSFMYRRSGLRYAGRWMILLGALSSIPAAYSGLYAFANVVRMSLPAGQEPNRPWAEVAQASQLSAQQWEFLGRHAWAQGASTVMGVLLVTIALGCSDRWRRKLYAPILLGLLFTLVVQAWGAWHGGEMVYRYGTAVLVNEAKGAMPAASVPQTEESAAKEQVEQKRRVEYFVPPLQLHVTLAGITVAVAMAALGLTTRSMATATPRVVPDEDLDPDFTGADFGARLDPAGAGAAGASAGRRRGTADLEMARILNPDAGVVHVPERVPSARFWMLTSLLALGAAAAGWWFLAGFDEIRTWEPRRLWAMVVPSQRRLWHSIAAGAIVAVPLLLALVARFGRRQRALFSLLALVLLAAVTLQAWLGILLMFDTPAGSIYRFNAAGAPAGTPATAPVTPPAPRRRRRN